MGPLTARRVTTPTAENRPVTTNGNNARFDDGPDGERAAKSFLSNSFVYAGAEAEALVNPAKPAGWI